MNVKSSLLAIKMLNAPTHLGPFLVPVMMDTKEMDGPAQVSTSHHHVVNVYQPSCVFLCLVFILL